MSTFNPSVFPAFYQGTSSVLQSPDGNWFALQNAQLSHLSLPNRRENPMFTALEKESSVVSAYDGMASDAESDAEVTWTAAWLEYHCKITTDTAIEDDQPAPENVSDVSDARIETAAGILRAAAHPLLKRKVGREHRSLYSSGTNLNRDSTENSDDGVRDSRVKRTRRKKLSKLDDAAGKTLGENVGEDASLWEPVRVLHHYILNL